jgi:hypothetical protein
MNLPGFTAEGSLYRSSGNYRQKARGTYGVILQVHPTALTKPIVQTIEDWLACVDNCTDDCPREWSSVRCGAYCAYTCTFPSGGAA